VIRRTKVAKSNDVKITFSLPNDQLNGNISVVGDFNDWRPGEHVMAKRANGTRSIAITVPEGTSFRFRYLGENGHWFDDDEAPRDGDAGRIDT